LIRIWQTNAETFSRPASSWASGFGSAIVHRLVCGIRVVRFGGKSVELCGTFYESLCGKAIAVVQFANGGRAICMMRDDLLASNRGNGVVNRWRCAALRLPSGRRDGYSQSLGPNFYAIAQIAAGGGAKRRRFSA
jgi:hypothetical protein